MHFGFKLLYEAVVRCRGQPPQLPQQVRSPLLEVDREPGQPVGMETDTEDVRRWSEYMIWEARDQLHGRGIPQHNVPGAVDDDARVRVLGVEHLLEPGPHPGHRGRV